MTKPHASSPTGLESLPLEEPTDSSLRRVSGMIIDGVGKGGGGGKIFCCCTGCDNASTGLYSIIQGLAGE